ncbi:DNA (cytosine-5-)-methyltransferase [Ancistrocladus abbreviatus]
MDLEDDAIGSSSFDWDTDDELEMEFCINSGPPQEVLAGFDEESENHSTEKDRTLSLLVDMGYKCDDALTAIDKCGFDAPVDELTDFMCAAEMAKDVKTADNREPSFVMKEKGSHLLVNDTTLSLLVDMGYKVEEALTAIDKCGFDASITELTDFIFAAEMAKDAEAADLEILSPLKKPREIYLQIDKKGKAQFEKKGVSIGCGKQTYYGRKRKRYLTDQIHKTRFLEESDVKQFFKDDFTLNLPNPMVGFGVPGGDWCVSRRRVPEAAIGPPYFYYENVAFTPKGTWERISQFLYDIEPEFVDSMYFSAAARKRGYIHNLPIQDRVPLLPIPPQTIHEAFPSTERWWPSWDKRTKLNCLLTCVGSAKLTERIRKAVEKWDGEPPSQVQKYVIQQCKKWNLVWVGQHKVAPLEPDEMEILLGFPENHTRGGGVSRSDRYKALGNSFQVDTVAYHLSVLKNIFPNGMNVLSLFSGIGGAEVALHRLGITLKNVVSVEISETNRNILNGWWEQTNQRGNLIHVADVHDVTPSKLIEWMGSLGAFDLVIGGSPCNNLAGGNRRTRDGLEGEQSSLFFQYYRILNHVRELTRKR